MFHNAVGLISNFTEQLRIQEIFSVSSGAVIGSWMRFYFVNLSSRVFGKKFYGTIFVNTLSTFLLSIISPFLTSKQPSSSEFILFYSIGFLGSLSTFSTYIIEIFQALVDKYWMQAFFIAFGTILTSFMAAYIGLSLATN